MHCPTVSDSAFVRAFARFDGTADGDATAMATVLNRLSACQDACAPSSATVTAALTAAARNVHAHAALAALLAYVYGARHLSQLALVHHAMRIGGARVVRLLTAAPPSAAEQAAIVGAPRAAKPPQQGTEADDDDDTAESSDEYEYEYEDGDDDGDSTATTENSDDSCPAAGHKRKTAPGADAATLAAKKAKNQSAARRVEMAERCPVHVAALRTFLAEHYVRWTRASTSVPLAKGEVHAAFLAWLRNANDGERAKTATAFRTLTRFAALLDTADSDARTGAFIGARRFVVPSPDDKRTPVTFASDDARAASTTTMTTTDAAEIAEAAEALDELSHVSVDASADRAAAAASSSSSSLSLHDARPTATAVGDTDDTAAPS